MRKLLLVLAFLGAANTFSLAQSPPAPSKSDTEAAKQNYQRGQKLVAAAAYRRALAEFSAGYELSGLPAFLFNMAECARLLGETERARDLYREYLSKDPNGSLAEKSKVRLTELGPEAAPAQHLPVVKTNPTAHDAKPVDLRVSNPVGAAKPLTQPVAEPNNSGDSPMWKKWPFWVGVGAVVIAGSAAAFYASRADDQSCSTNCVRF